MSNIFISVHNELVVVIFQF